MEIKVFVVYEFYVCVVEYQWEVVSVVNILCVFVDFINGLLLEVVIFFVGVVDEIEWVVWNGVDEKLDFDLEMVVEVYIRDGWIEIVRVCKIWWKYFVWDDKDFNSDIIWYWVKGGV